MPTIRQILKNPRLQVTRLNAARRLNGCPQKHGVVSKIRITTPKKPNSARRKVARVKLSTGLMVTARIIGQGHNLQSYSHVLVRAGRANDVPGVRYTLIKGVKDFSWEETTRRFKSRSKYGISLEHIRTTQDA